MRILQVADRFYPVVGGVEKHVEDLCFNLIKLGHRADVCCLNRYAHSSKKLKSREIYRGINIYRIPYLKLSAEKDLPYRVAPKILKIIKPYDIIHVHGLGFFSDTLSITKPFHKKPLILSTHGGMFHTKKPSPIKEKYFYKLCRKTLKNFDKIIAVSKNDEELFSKISEKVVFIPNGVDFKIYSEIKRLPKKNSFLFIGRLSSNKGIDHLIEVVYLLKDKIPDIKLYIVGKDWRGQRKILEDSVKEKNLDKNIIFTGGVSEKEKIDYLKKSEFFVSASEYEGFGISVLEAMAAGLPVIVNDIDAFRSFVEDGKNGFIADYSNPKKTADYIFGILNKTDLSKISENAINTAKEYDWKELAKRIKNIYKEYAK